MLFRTRDLLHKWGFEDGDILIDFLHDHGFDLGMLDHGAILRVVVEGHVLPAIRNVIEWRTLSTMHNPVRITSVDGLAVDNMRIDHPDINLVPESVDVSDGIILEHARLGLANHAFPSTGRLPGSARAS